MDSTLTCLAMWLPHQRWFSASLHASVPSLRLLADIELGTDESGAVSRILIVAVDAAVDTAADTAVDASADHAAHSPAPAAAGPAIYQVPIVVRPGADAAHSPGLIGVTADGEALIDGPRDPAFTDALLRAVRPEAGPAPAEILVGEQSNTSIIFRPASGHPIICKVFRPLNEGLNPDIELQSALAGAASPYVPASMGVLEGQWADPRDPRQTVAGSLAFAQEFFPGVEDAWRVALRAAAASADFTAAADALGRATGAVHLDLARLFPAPLADETGRRAITEAWRRRLSIAVTEVPDLLPFRSAIDACYARAAEIAWPSLQRIHGDYHLGQVLQVPSRGWVLLDFEGEPMRPMSERRAPDLAARDIAGMLRSFDYVAGSLTLASGSAREPASGHTRRSARASADAATAVASWADAARAAFLAGYRDATSTDPAGPLLDALELDKAVYEAIYEARHRPEWLTIPLSAVARLAAR